MRRCCRPFGGGRPGRSSCSRWADPGRHGRRWSHDGRARLGFAHRLLPGRHLAALVVRRGSIFTAMVQPPLVLIFGLVVGGMLFTNAGGLYGTALRIIGTFPTMAIGTAAAVLIGLIRILAQPMRSGRGAVRPPPLTPSLPLRPYRFVRDRPIRCCDARTRDGDQPPPRSAVVPGSGCRAVRLRPRCAAGPNAVRPVQAGSGGAAMDRSGAALPSLTVLPAEYGFDGQFFYRLAISPFSPRRRLPASPSTSRRCVVHGGVSAWSPLLPASASRPWCRRRC